MNCHYHEENAAVRTCSRCAKPLCETCVHAEYPEYCWSCGLEQENESAEREKAFRVPGWILGGTGAYLFRKLAAAGGTYVVIGLAFALLFGFAGIDASYVAGIVAGTIASSVTYTFGIAYSALVDGAAKLARLERWPVKPLLYALGGLLYVAVCPLIVSFGTIADTVLYLVCAVIFLGFDRLFRSPRRRVASFAVAAVTGVPVVFLWAFFGFSAWQGFDL